jgi:long-subunit fatty acid transport protein
VGESQTLTTALVPGGMDDPDNDVLVSIEAADRFTPNANIGLLIDPIEQLTIGLALEPPTHFHAKGTGILDFTGNNFEPLLDQSVYEDDDVHLDIAIPLVLRAGIAVRPVHPLELEAALVYQKWSALESIQIEDVNVALKFKSAALQSLGAVPTEFTLPAGLDDTTSYRFGAEWRAIPELALRAGGFYETGSLSPEDVSVALYDPDKWQLSGGASAFLLDQRLRFDAAFAWLHFDSLAVEDSTVTQVNALDGPAGVVGNGDYRSHGWVVGLAGSWTFKHHDRSGADASARRR